MTTQTLKLKTNIINNNDIRKRILRLFIMSGLFLSLCYMLLLANMVWNIVNRRNIEEKSRVLSTEVSALELQYLSMSNKIDLNMAYALGFKETSKKEFATRKALGSVAVLSNEL